jgi:hypothetical membrane protein
MAQTDNTRKILLLCGIAAPFVYVGADLLAGLVYPGYSFADQAVSELFAIGAPTSRIVIPLFTLGSLLLIVFAIGVWQSADVSVVYESDGKGWGTRESARMSRMLRLLALMFLGSALNGLVLWNFFPMHMRGAERTFTDTMHLVLAANPFVLLSIIFAIAAFRSWFRGYSIATIVLLFIPAVVAFSLAPRLDANQPTPWLGLAERFSQYIYDVWQLVLAAHLLRGRRVAKVIQHPKATSPTPANTQSKS